MRPPVSARLALDFDAPAMLAEAQAIADGGWVAHFNQGYHDGGWFGAALRSVGGDAARLYAGAHDANELRDSPLMARCPSIAAALARFQCPLRAVRLLRLAPGAVIREHTDSDLRFEQGEARLHIPLATSDAVEFYVDGQRVIMEAGECWYLDLSRPHRVTNRGDRDRVHLVVDCAVNDWLAALVSSAIPVERVTRRPSGQEEFARFRERAFGDDALQAALRDITDAKAFVQRTVALGAERGFAFLEDDVRAAMNAGRRAWLSQWMV